MPPETTLADAMKVLEQHGLVAQPSQRSRRATDPLARPIRLRAATGGPTLEVSAKVVRSVTSTTLGAVLNQVRHLEAEGGHPTLLVTDYVAPPVAAKLREIGQRYVDTAGNAFVQGDGLFVWVQGQKPPKAARLRTSDRAYTNAGLRLVFALLCDPELATRPYRTIAEAADVALGAVPAILADLARQGRLAVAGRNRRCTASKPWLDDWAAAYARTLRPKTLLGRYATKDLAGWQNWNLADVGGKWGGEAAANLLTGHLTPGVVTVYAKNQLGRFIAEHRLETVDDDDPTANVELRAPFWGATLEVPEFSANIAPPVLVYADLLATGDARCREAADQVYEHFLARRFAER